MSGDDDAPKCKTVKTLFRHNTKLCADSIEWHPFEPYQNTFICGNYEYQEGSPEEPARKRLGKLLIGSISPANGLQIDKELDTAAVLDIKWCHNKINNHAILGVAQANQKVTVYSVNGKELEILTDFEIADDSKDTLALSLDWSTGKYDSCVPEIVCSDSKGQIHLLKLEQNNLTHIKTWKGHSFQAWISAFYYWDPNIFFSGGDDALFLQYDKRAGDLPVVKNKKHETGVTSMHSNKEREFILATGSYDEKLRLWDIRTLKTPLFELRMPGPLWRLKWDPFKQNHLIAACMLGGVHIVKALVNGELELFDSFYEHKNIAYGTDWCFFNEKEVALFENEGNVMFGSCSFYDKLICITKMKCQWEGK